MNSERVLCEGRQMSIEKEHMLLYNIVCQLHTEVKTKIGEWENYKNTRYHHLLIVRDFIFRMICAMENPAAGKTTKTLEIFASIRDFVSKREEMIDSLRHVRSTDLDRLNEQSKRAGQSVKWLEEIFTTVKIMLANELEQLAE